MLRRLIEIIKEKRERDIKNQERQEYIQKRVMETQREIYKNRESKSTTSNKKYFFDSNVYGTIFK